MTARTWTDEQILEALALMDHDKLTASAVAKRFRTTKNAILGLRFKTLGPMSARMTPEPGDGTMPARWWVR